MSIKRQVCKVVLGNGTNSRNPVSCLLCLWFQSEEPFPEKGSGSRPAILSLSVALGRKQQDVVGSFCGWKCTVVFLAPGLCGSYTWERDGGPRLEYEFQGEVRLAQSVFPPKCSFDGTLLNLPSKGAVCGGEDERRRAGEEGRRPAAAKRRRVSRPAPRGSARFTRAPRRPVAELPEGGDGNTSACNMPMRTPVSVRLLRMHHNYIFLNFLGRFPSRPPLFVLWWNIHNLNSPHNSFLGV